MPLLIKSWYRWWDSNPHGDLDHLFAGTYSVASFYKHPWTEEDFLTIFLTCPASISGSGLLTGSQAIRTRTDAG